MSIKKISRAQRDYIINLIRDDIKQQEGYLIIQNDADFCEQTKELEKIKTQTKQEIKEKKEYLNYIEK